MRKHTRLNVAARLQHITEAQAGYFTRSQAHHAGVADFELDRALDYDQTVRLATGIYRLVGAPVDPHEALRVAWLRLTPKARSDERLLRPTVWVSHRSAAIVHGFGDYIADRPEFTATNRIRPRFDVKIRVRSGGVERSEWVVRHGFAVTSVARTFVDLAAAHPDGGHLGRYVQEAMAAGAVTRQQLDSTSHNRVDVGQLLAMAEK